MTPDLRIGTSGWNYPAGRGTWNGVFYPPARKRPKGFDELAFYASHFDTVEVNSTFYGQPRAAVCRAWAERTPAPQCCCPDRMQRENVTCIVRLRLRCSLSAIGFFSQDAVRQHQANIMVGQFGEAEWLGILGRWQDPHPDRRGNDQVGRDLNAAPERVL